MTLLLPLALLGLLTLPAILLLHLLRNRREQIAIPSLRLWQGLQRRKHGALPRQIPLSLMLLLQLLAAAALTFSLARPALSFVLNQPRRAIFVLDTSTSMTALAEPAAGRESNSRFDQARRTIAAWVETMRPGDSLALVSLSAQPEILLTSTAEQKAATLLALENLVPGGTGANLSTALSLAGGLVASKPDNQIIVLTDGYDPDLDLGTLPTLPAPVAWRFIPETPPQPPASGNQALLDASSRTLPDGQHRLFVRVVNYSNAPVTRQVQVLVDEQRFAIETVPLEPQADAVRLWTLPAGAQTAALEIIEPDLLPLDNRADLFLGNSSERRVLLVSDTPDTLARALSVQPAVELTIAPPNAAYSPAEFDLVVFDGLPLALTEWPRTGVLVVNPPLGHPLLSSAQSTARNLRPDPDTASDLLAGVDLSGVYFNRAPALELPDWAAIDLAAATSASALSDAPPLIFHGTVAGSRIMVWNFDLAASNLPARLALPLLTANALASLLTPAPPPAVPLGQPVTLPRNFSIETPDGQRLFTGAAETSTIDNRFTRTRQPGLYQIYNQSDSLVAGFAVHAGAPPESNLTQRLSVDELAGAVQVTRTGAQTAETAWQEYWPWLAGLALLVITAEGWLAWRK